jgi:hypothetical protein
LRAAADFPCHFPPDLRVVAFFLDFLLAALEALSLLAGEAGESFVAGFFFVFVFVAVFQLLLLGVTVDGATTVPDVFFDFLSPPLSFFAPFPFVALASPNFTSSPALCSKNTIGYYPF